MGQAQAGRVVAAKNKQGLAQLREEERVTIRTASFTGKRFNSLNLLTMKNQNMQRKGRLFTYVW